METDVRQLLPIRMRILLSSPFRSCHLATKGLYQTFGLHLTLTNEYARNSLRRRNAKNPALKVAAVVSSSEWPQQARSRATGGTMYRNKHTKG